MADLYVIRKMIDFRSTDGIDSVACRIGERSFQSMRTADSSRKLQCVGGKRMGSLRGESCSMFFDECIYVFEIGSNAFSAILDFGPTTASQSTLRFVREKIDIECVCRDALQRFYTGRTSFSTTAPVPIIAPLPMVTPDRTVLRDRSKRHGRFGRHMDRRHFFE